jgi:hypothetical protein
MPERESCGSVLPCRFPPFDLLLAFHAYRRARRLELPSRLPSRTAGTHSAEHIALAAQPAPYFPRLRALALFSRRPPHRVVRPSFRRQKTCTQADTPSHISLCQELRNFVDVLDEKPRDRARRTVLQGDHSKGQRGYSQLNRQSLELRAPDGKTQYGARQHR